MTSLNKFRSSRICSNEKYIQASERHFFFSSPSHNVSSFSGACGGLVSRCEKYSAADRGEHYLRLINVERLFHVVIYARPIAVGRRLSDRQQSHGWSDPACVDSAGVISF